MLSTLRVNHYSLENYHSTKISGRPIYHTNVFMAITRKLAIICLEAVREEERPGLERELRSGGRKIINLSRSQVENLAGNCYEVVGEDGRDKFIISTR